MHDYHAHSSFSGDCNFSLEEMIEGAIKNKCTSIAFTDHIDYDYGNEEYSDLFIFNPDEYLDKIKEVKEKYKNHIRILSGVEMGLQPHLASDIEKRFPFDSFEFTIMSIHTADRKDLHDGAFFRDKSSIEAYKCYYEELLNCVEGFKKYQVLGHVNLIDRYAKYLNDPVQFSDYSYILKEIFKIIISEDKGIEVNTSGYRYGMKSFLPNSRILELYRDLGGRLITFGSDSHCPSDILKYSGETLDTLEKIGINEVSIFDEKGNPNQIKINKLLMDM